MGFMAHVPVRRLVAATLFGCWFLFVSTPVVASQELSDSSGDVFVASRSVDLQRQLAEWVRVRMAQEGWSVTIQPMGSWGEATRQLGGHPDGWRAAWREPVRQDDGWVVTCVLTPVGQVHVDSMRMIFRFRAREQRAVWRVTNPIVRGQPMACGLVQRDALVMRGSLRPWQGDCAELTTQVARRPLSAGAVLSENDVGHPPAVLAQQVAIAFTRVRGIEIQASAQVLVDAQLGQRVPVRIQGHDKVIHAVVIAPGQVQVLEGMK